MRNVLLIMLLLITNTVFSQKLTEVDSLVRRKYYHRIFPKAINSKSDILYEGIDNVLETQFPDEASKKFRLILKTNNGSIFNVDKSYLAIPRNSGRAFVSTYIIGINNDTFLVGKKEFEVQKVPLPGLKIGNTVISDQCVIDKQSFFSADTLKVFFTDDIEDSENWCSVKYFILGYSFGGRYISIENKGAKLSNATREFIERLKPNENVVIKVTNINCSLIYNNLPLIRFKIK